MAGNPLPTTITVEKQDTQTGVYVDYPSTKYSVIGLNTISFSGLTLDDSGQYRACVENSHDTIGCHRFTILVKGDSLICYCKCSISQGIKEPIVCVIGDLSLSTS